MSKNTKSRVIRAADAAVTGACLLGAAAFLCLFYLDLNRSFRRLNEEPVGVVASRNGAALRRFQDRNIWDRLRKDSSVYNGDFIRTAERAEAAVGFPDGTLVGIAENSLIRIFVEAGVARLDFTRGNISVRAGKTGSVVSFGGNQVKAAAGSVLSLEAETGEEFSLQVLEGDASLVTPEGEREAAAGTAVSLNAEGTESAARLALLEPPPAARFLSPAGAPVPVRFVWNDPAGSPEASARIEIARNRDFHRPVTVWEGSSRGAGAGTAAGDPAGAAAAGAAGDPAGAETAGVSSEITALIPPGTWWWRFSRSGETEEAPRQLAVARVPPPEPVSPAPDAAYYYRTETPELRFQWDPSEDALYYVFEAADNPDMSDPALQTEVRYNSLVYSRLPEGRWYWRVTPVFPALYRGTVPASPVVPFTITRGDPPARLAEEAAEIAEAAEPLTAAGLFETAAAAAPPPAPPAPVLSVEPAPPPAVKPAPPVPPPAAPPLPAASGRRPESGYVINPAALGESRTIVFSWNPVAGADAYVFTLFRETESGARQSVVSSEGPETSFTLTDLSLLDLGRFVWRVEAFNRETGGIPGENRFTVNIPQPDAPRARPPEVFYGR